MSTGIEKGESFFHGRIVSDSAYCVRQEEGEDG
jgi:hypothetical protein